MFGSRTPTSGRSKVGVGGKSGGRSTGRSGTGTSSRVATGGRLVTGGLSSRSSRPGVSARGTPPRSPAASPTSRGRSTPKSPGSTRSTLSRGTRTTAGATKSAKSPTSVGRTSSSLRSAGTAALGSKYSSGGAASGGGGGRGDGGGGGGGEGGEILSFVDMTNRDLLHFSLKDLAMEKTVGTGTFGRVRVVRHKTLRRYFALKILKKSEVIRLKQVDHIRNEVQILSKIDHPFIVNLAGWEQDDRKLYMLLEFVPGGEIFSHLRSEGKFEDKRANFYAAEITLAFEYLHLRSLVYRDLKPENLLLSSKGHVKITDFGFAKYVTDRTYTLCGTPEYLAPEIIKSRGHDKSVDWWALGVLIYEMLAGYPPFFDENPYGIYQKILGGRLEFAREIGSRARDLIRRLLTADRTRRLGCLRGAAEDVKAHKWFAKVDWGATLALSVPTPFTPKVKAENDTTNFEVYSESDGEGGKDLKPEEAKLFADF